MKQYSLYLFDFDGTLFDTLDSLKAVYYDTLKKYGYICKESDYSQFLGLSLPRTREYAGIDIKYEQEMIDYFHHLVHTHKISAMSKLYPDTLETFKYMHEHNIKYGIVTGSSTWRVKDVFSCFNITTSKIATIVGNDKYHHPKPDAEPILIALKETDYLNKKDEVLYVGDAKQDKDCADSAGVDVVLVSRDGGSDINSLLDIFK